VGGRLVERVMQAPTFSIVDFFFKKRPRKSGLKPRLSARLAIKGPALLFSNHQGHLATLHDVSAGGACLRTQHRLRPGERIALSMSFGPNQRYEVQAVVVYILPGARGLHARYGVRFLWKSIDEHHRLYKFVKERA
jgi:PilZ domain-containing protein